MNTESIKLGKQKSFVFEASELMLVQTGTMTLVVTVWQRKTRAEGEGWESRHGITTGITAPDVAHARPYCV